jgi:hypothetical protein
VNYQEVINIASKFDAKGFKQAETALGKLASTTKKLAGAAGIAYGAAAITAYGKAAVKAFAQDEAAALRLNRAVENLGIGFANPAIADYISKLEKSAAIADDILRPAFQGLLTTTGSLTQSQKLLNDAITISRASGIDLATVSEDLAKGYVGITKGLAKYNTGLTKAELTSKSFSEILGVMLTRSAGAAQDYLGSTSYAVDVLSIATNNASEIIGGGLVDALARIGGGTEASDAATAIEGIAKAIANVERAIGVTIGAIPSLIKNLKNLPAQIFGGFAGKQTGINLSPVKKQENKLTLTQVQQQEALAKMQAAAAKREKELLSLKNKQNTADKLKLAIAKANLALGKGGNIFDMDAIQLAAAQINQAELLGKATNAAQVLAIANDVQRLNVKQSMYDLEQAIASGDAAAIEAATAKLNKDVEILGQLNGQKATVQSIADILKGIQPKALIDIENLNTALALLKLIGTTPSAPNLSTPAGVAAATANLPASVTASDFYNSLTPSQQDQLGGYVPNIGADIPTVDPITNGGSGVGLGNNGTGRQIPAAANVNITVNTGVGDPNAIAEAINQVIQDAVDRGTLRGGAY